MWTSSARPRGSIANSDSEEDTACSMRVVAKSRTIVCGTFWYVTTEVRMSQARWSSKLSQRQTTDERRAYIECTYRVARPWTNGPTNFSVPAYLRVSLSSSSTPLGIGQYLPTARTRSDALRELHDGLNDGLGQRSDDGNILSSAYTRKSAYELLRRDSRCTRRR